WFSASALGKPARDDHTEDAGHDGRRGKETDDARAREIPNVLQVAVGQLRRRRVEDVGEERDDREEREPSSVGRAEHLTELTARDACRFERVVAAGLGGLGGQARGGQEGGRAPAEPPPPRR